VPVLRADISGRRLRELAEAALGLLSDQGYERCQVADVAKAMGVAVGTVYLYVESKEALFDLVLKYAAREDPSWLDTLEVPVKTPPPGTTLELLKGAFEVRAEWPVLMTALKQERAWNVEAELKSVLREQYELTLRYRRVLMLLLRSATEFPGLTQVFVNGLRDRLLLRLAEYLELRATAGQLRQAPDFKVVAALMIQAIAWATLQRPGDPGLAMLDDDAVETATLDLLVHGMIPLSIPVIP
jgi:AcrR family transcriptional regulator